MDAAWVGSITALAVALVSMAVWTMRKIFSVANNTQEFLSDWRGEPDRPGVPGRAGVMSRLHDLEQKVAQVLAETRPDHGHSLRDVVHGTADDVSQIKQRQNDISDRLGRIEQQKGVPRDRPDGQDTH